MGTKQQCSQQNNPATVSFDCSGHGNCFVLVSTLASDVLTAVTEHTLFWDVTSHSAVDSYVSGEFAVSVFTVSD
jgi:hypothetical protein